MTPPVVTVVMPAYQAATTVGAAASSVLWQTLPDVELVVVDDGSADGTAEIAAALPGPIRVLRQPNQGVAAARNTGVAAARGEFVAFCDADDVLFPGHLEALLQTWHGQAAGGLATANAYWLLPGGITPTKLRHRGRFPRYDEQRTALLQTNFVSTMSLLPRRLFDSVGGFDPGLRQAEDWDLWLRLVFAGHRVAHQPRPLALYRRTSDGLSSRVESFYAAEREVLQRVAGWPQLTAAERRIIDRRLAMPPPRAIVREADGDLRAGHYLAAARRYRQAASLAPAETLLVRKARLLSAAPFLVGPLLRRRLARAAGTLGVDDRDPR